jgi:hypothetical protein
VAAALLAAGVYVVVFQYMRWRGEVWLIRNGTPVQGKIEQSGGERIAGRPVLPGASILLSYDWNGERRESWGTLVGHDATQMVLTKSMVTVRVDPSAPDRWTSRREPPSLLPDLLGAALAFALAPLAMLTAVVLRRAVLRTWRYGSAADAIVVGRHGTALAPGTRAVKCTPAAPETDEPAGEVPSDVPSAGGSRVQTVYVPLKHSEAGENRLRVILPPGGRGRPLSAAWFE